MSKIKYRCEFCDTAFDSEDACLEHEVSHSTLIACRKIKGEKITECELKIIRYTTCVSLLILWQAEQCKISYEFQLNNEESRKLAEALTLS